MTTELKEKSFSQLFDTIIEKKRLVLDVEDYYSGKDTISLFLNGTTGKMSENLDEVKTEREFKLIPYDRYSLYKESSGYSVQYSEENDCLFFHLLLRAPISRFTSGAKYKWEEITRFAIDRKTNIYTKANGYKNNERSKWANGNLEKAKALFANECDNGEYFFERAYGKASLPVNEQHWNTFNNYVNAKNGSSEGFLEESSKVLPAIFNVKGNEYESLDSYLKLGQFLEVLKNGITCLKKSGAKQDMVDKLISYKLPDVKKPEIKTHKNSIYKFAVIQKVPNPDEDMCVIRTFNYTQNVLFEGGRIYVSKKDVLFCKVNNVGDYVHQPLLSKVNHWDFEIEKFPETETSGTKLEYFGKIVQNIEPDNRAIAIWMFLKEPFLETLCKISSEDFANTFVDALRDTQNIDTVFYRGLGVSNRSSKKAFQVLGMSSNQFNIMKDSFPYLLCRSYYDSDLQEETSTLGALPIIKKLLVNNYNGDISAIDINTFNDYYDFVSTIFSLYDCYKHRKSVINRSVNEIINAIDKTKQLFPNFDIRYNFKLFEEIISNIVKNNRMVYYNTFHQMSLYNDFLEMSTKVEDKVRPKLDSFDDLKTMHDNIMILIEMKENAALVDKFKERKPVWEKWEFRQDEKISKKGEIIQEDVKFVVISPNVPYDLAKEGTELHHCVKNYIDRVAEGKTNILFIRKKDDIDTPFFTVEVSNESKIMQVHGMQNRNACTEEGLPEFISYWAKKCRLKEGGYNIVR